MCSVIAQRIWLTADNSLIAHVATTDGEIVSLLIAAVGDEIANLVIDEGRSPVLPGHEIVVGDRVTVRMGRSQFPGDHDSIYPVFSFDFTGRREKIVPDNWDEYEIGRSLFHARIRPNEKAREVLTK